MITVNTILYFLTAANVVMVLMIAGILWVLLAPMREQETCVVWLKWDGEEPHPPGLAPNDFVEVVRNSGRTESGLACEFNWRHVGSLGDITHFRVTSHASKLRPGKWNESDGSGT